MLKAYLSAQASSLSAFVISKTLISGQKPCGRQLNTKVCGNESAIFRVFFFVTTFVQTTITQKLYANKIGIMYESKGQHTFWHATLHI